MQISLKQFTGALAFADNRIDPMSKMKLYIKIRAWLVGKLGVPGFEVIQYN